MPKARTCADLTAQHSRIERLSRRLAEIITQIRKVGPEHWEYESDLNKPPYGGIAAREIASLREQFTRHVVHTTPSKNAKRGRIVWFGDTKVAARMREALTK